MKKIISAITAVVLSICLCSCGDDGDKNDVIYQNFKSYISENGTEDDYYIQISKTANSANTLIEASKMDDDCAYMEYDISGKLKFYRNNTLTEISSATYFVPEKKDAKWSDLEFEKINEKYRKILSELLEIDAEKTIEKKKNDDKNMPYSVNIEYDTKKRDTKVLFSNSGNFGMVNIKFETNKTFDKFSNVSVSCQYDYDGVIYLYSVTFGKPCEPDAEGKNGRRPEDIEEIFDSYKSTIEARIMATE